MKKEKMESKKSPTQQRVLDKELYLLDRIRNLEQETKELRKNKELQTIAIVILMLCFGMIVFYLHQTQKGKTGDRIFNVFVTSKEKLNNSH